MFNFEKLIVWQKAVEFADGIYDLSKQFPKDEIFGLTSQIRRAAISISLNIAEGAGRKSDKEFSQFMSIANGSMCEVITILKFCLRRKFIDETRLSELYRQGEEISKMLIALSRR